MATAWFTKRSWIWVAGSAVVLVWLCLSGAENARAQTPDARWSPDIYKGMADASSSATIPPGTKITLRNWQQYRQFMPYWMQAAYAGNFHFKVGPEPEYTVVVDATHTYPLPRKWRDDGEKYGSQVQLVKDANGGWLMKGWVAGPPFPHPSGPNKSIEDVYNVWCSFRPYILHFDSTGWLIDRFGNRTSNDSDDTFYQVSHLSEPGMPVDMPFGKGFFYAARFLVLSPEQSKYTTALQIQPDDPAVVPNNYVFLPSLRRSLRLSSAARCAPINGTDAVNDDNVWNPPNYNATFMGTKKLLVNVQDPAKAYDPHSYVGIADPQPGSFPDWPKAGTGHWELRNMDVIDLKWLPSLGSYCFSHRIFYIDRDTWLIPFAENWDNNQKFWKQLWEKYAPLKFHGEETLSMLDGIAASCQLDWQNGHMTAGTDTEPTMDNDVPGEYKDAASMTSPGSLARIMK
ncbi:MAG: DUF1329 domain-containing protein [Candidatus Binataceae bacterium]